jgi:hypothetical protein
VSDLSDEHLDNLETGYSGVVGTAALQRMISEIRRHRTAQASSKERVRDVVAAALKSVLIMRRFWGALGSDAERITGAVASHAAEQLGILLSRSKRLVSAPCVNCGAAAGELCCGAQECTAEQLASPVVLSADATPRWIPPSERVGDPGSCTLLAHSWVSGSATCRCGEAIRDGDCRGWRVASRLTGDQIYEAVTGTKKPPAPPEIQARPIGEAGPACGHVMCDVDCREGSVMLSAEELELLEAFRVDPSLLSVARNRRSDTPVLQAGGADPPLVPGAVEGRSTGDLS